MSTITELLEKFGIDSVELIRGNIARAGQNATGKTAAAIQWMTPSPKRLVVDGPKFVYVLETGRGPNKNQSPDSIQKFVGWAGSTFIKDWATDKPVEYNPYSIAHVIAKNGTKLFQQGGRKDIITPALDESRIDKLTAQIADIGLTLTLNKIDEAIK